ncbi:stage IV sporulation protein FB [Clostridium acetireducens DSM 10703]|uniref:Stage IV sporulation protein FB n=1 Tax=Clostridium acetireducens DSM 10703 TaxID=1121290 RepID=A0A1E8F1B8_9CLOT|nr:M50 family metallopeptidase [Clostridium acetireducens]OFI07220.1 stage IV sporulation protein FB [Clostridium acetireducens DSM 10703]
MIKVNKYFIPYILILLILGFKGEIFLDFLIVIFHEIVHYITARYYGFSGFAIEILPVGAVLKLKDLEEASVKEDLIISLSGPVANLILALIFYVLNFKIPSLIFEALFIGNATIGLFNLIPAFPLDGGRIIRDILCTKFLYKKANEITVYISIIIASFMMFFFIFLFFVNKVNLNIGLVSLIMIIFSLKEKERIVYIIMGDIIKKKYKFLKRGYLENKYMSIYYKTKLLDILGMLDKSKYGIFTVLDNNMKVMDIIYEEEVIEALKLYGNISVEKFIKIENRL